MRRLWRTTGSTRGSAPGSTLARDVALVCLADGLVGLSFGATAVAGGLRWWVPVAMSVLVFAGGSQIAAVGVVLAGGSPFAAVAAGAVLNSRLFPYGLAVADVVGTAGAPGAGPAVSQQLIASGYDVDYVEFDGAHAAPAAIVQQAIAWLAT